MKPEALAEMDMASWKRISLLVLSLLLVSCGEPQDDDDSAPSDDDDTGAADDDDTSEGPQGLLARYGTATVSGSAYEGSEELFFAADFGQGEDICRIRYPLTSTAVRDDCADCSWAFDLVLGTPELIAETEPGCLATVGVDSATLGDLEGTEVSYGYNPDYFGHIQMLVVDQGGTWDGAGHASWDTDSGEFSYEWEDGYHPY